MHAVLDASTGKAIGELIVVILIFIFVLFITAVTTRWIANFQKEKSVGENISIIETKKIAPNKLIEIVRIGDKYYALALGKDEVSLIDELPEESVNIPTATQESFSFKEILNKVKETGEDQTK